MKAQLTNYRQSPRKVALVADLLRGKRVPSALSALGLLNKRAAQPLEKLLLSALSNAKLTHNLAKEDLFIKEFRVEQGVTIHRHRPRARGRASDINKRSSHVLIVLEELSKMKNGKITSTGRMSTPVDGVQNDNAKLKI